MIGIVGELYEVAGHKKMVIGFQISKTYQRGVSKQDRQYNS